MCISGALGAVGGLMQAGAAGRAADAQVAAAREQMALQERMLQAQLDLQRDMYDTTRADLGPYRTAGIPATQAAQFLLGLGNAPMVGGEIPEIEERDGRYFVGDEEFGNIGAAEAYAYANPIGGTPYSFETTPGYEFAVNENLDAIEGSAAARGGLYSGATMQALGERANALANLEFGNNFNRVMSVAGMGQASAAQQAQANQNMAQMGSNAYLNNAQMGSTSLANMGDAQAAGIIGQGNALAGMFGDLSGLWGYQQYQSGGQPAAATAASSTIRPMPRPSFTPAPTIAPYVPPYMPTQAGRGPF